MRTLALLTVALLSLSQCKREPPTIAPEPALDAAAQSAVEAVPDAAAQPSDSPVVDPPHGLALEPALDAGGDAVMHAIGIELAAGSADSPCQSRFISASVNRLARSLAKSQRPEAMLYLIRAVAMTVEHTQSHSQESSWQAYEGLLQIAGGEVQPIVPPLGSPYSGFYANWEDVHEYSTEHWQAALNHWMRWYVAHRAETPAQWQAANLPRTRAELRGASPYRSLVAAIVLFERASDRAAVERFVSEQLTGHERDDEPPALVRPLGVFASQRALPGGDGAEAFRWLD